VGRFCLFAGCRRTVYAISNYVSLDLEEAVAESGVAAADAAAAGARCGSVGASTAITDASSDVKAGVWEEQQQRQNLTECVAAW
jgi:hypothetical protein